MNEDQEVDSSQQQSTTTNNSSPSTGAGPTSQTKSASPTPHQLPQPTIFTSVGTPSDVQQIWTAYGAQALWKFKLTDLKNELRSKGLVVTGNKPHIISRLHEQYMADLAQNHQPSSLSGAFSSINSGSNGTGPDAAATTTIGNEQQESSSNEEKSLSGNGEASLKEPSDEANMLNSSFYQQQAGFRPGSLTPSANGSRLPPYVAMQQLMNSGFYPTSSGTTTTSSTVSTPPATKTKPTKTPSPPQSSSSASPSSSTNPNTGIVSPSSSTSLKTPVSSKMQGSPNSQSSTTTTPVKPSPSAAVLSSESPPSPVVPRTGIESIRSSFRPTITIPRALTPACDPSVYSTFSPASAQYMPHAFSGGNQSGTKKVVKKKVVKKVVKSAQSTIPATSNTIPSPPQSQNAKLNPTLAKPPRQLKASSKLKVKKKDSLGVPIPTSTTPAISNPVATSTAAPPVVLNANGTVPKRRGRPPKNKNAMSAITVPPPPTVLTSSGKIVKKVRKIRKDARKVDPVAIASGDLRKLGKEVDSESRSSQQIEDSLNSDATSESDVETSCNFDNYFNMEDDGMSLNSSASMTTDLAESFLTATDLNLVGEIDRPSSSMASRKRALLEDEFYGLTYSSDGSPHKRPRHGDIDDDSFFICSTVQEVPESILESALMEETFGACQSEYCFEVNLVKHNSKPSVSSAMGDGIFTMMDEEFETRKLSVGGSVSLHDLTKSVIELFTYDTYGGAGADLGVDSDSLYVLMLPCGRELVNPESAPKPKKSSDSLQVASAKLSDQEVLSITFPTKDDPTKTQCVFNLRVERISITSAADDGDLLLTNDEEDAEMMMDFMVDSYLTNCDADVEDEAGSSEDDGNSSSDDGGSNDEDGPAVDDLLDIDVIIDGQFLIEGM